MKGVGIFVSSVNGRKKDMDSREYLEKKYVIEMRLYELLGIKLFRKIVLLFERIRHVGNGRQNENYHPQDKSTDTLSRFSGYLIYNSMFHVVSLILVAVYFAATRILNVESVLFDVVMIVVSAVDVYCLMLQRYIYIRFRRQLNKRRSDFLAEKSSLATEFAEALDGRTPESLEKEIEFLQDFRDSILSGKNVFLTGDDKEILMNIAAIIKAKPSEEESVVSDVYFSELLGNLPKRKRVVTAKQSCVSLLQNVFKTEKKNNVLFGVCVVTVDSETEAYYKKIFPNPTADGISETVEVLLDAYGLHRKETVQK